MLQLPTRVRAIQTKYENEIQRRHWTTNQRRNVYRNLTEHEKREYEKTSFGHWHAKQHSKYCYSNADLNRTKAKSINYSNYTTDVVCRQETKTTHEIFWVKQSDKHRRTVGTNWSNFKKGDYPDFSIDLLIKIYNVDYRQEITGKTVGSKGFRRTENSRIKTTEYIGQKNKEDTLPEAPKSNPEKEIKDEPIEIIPYTGKYGTTS